MREIEVKVKVRNEAALKAKLAGLKVELGKAKKQHDVIFCTPGSKDYEKGSQWLRIRTEDDVKHIFTLKIDNGRRLDSTEYELDISDPEEMGKAIRAMGYELYCDLTKVRQKAKHQDIELCFDRLEGLGLFVEAEKLTHDDEDHEKVLKELWNLLEKLGLKREDEVTDSYDVLLRAQSVVR